jgi:ribonuclease HII
MIGIDEVGRGAWAGPLVVCAVRFAHLLPYAGELADSKQLNQRIRARLADLLRSDVEFGIGVADSHYIDKHGLTKSTQYAILQALEKVEPFDKICIDGRVNYLQGTVYEERSFTKVKADTLVPEVMAASIIAKEYRDQLMRKFHAQYPGYGFDTNVGYGTSKHLLALKTQGYAKIHRKLYRIKGLQ